MKQKFISLSILKQLIYSQFKFYLFMLAISLPQITWGQKLIGVSQGGGTYGLGTIYQYDFDLNSIQLLHSIERINPGANPQNTKLAEYQGKFYGMTRAGGTSSQGVIFEWNPTTNAYTKKIDFSSSIGSQPYGSLTLYNDKFYGMTSNGGVNNAGVIFEWDPATNVYTKKFDFDNANGRVPFNSLSLYNDKFYGMTFQGGANNRGVIFEWDPATNFYIKKIDLSSATGGSPRGNLTMHNGLFYGMTSDGGSNGLGVIFEWNLANNVYTKKVDFNNTNGANPTANSLTVKDNKLYGMTYGGGFYGKGVLFEWDPITNALVKKYDFDNQLANPNGDLTVVGDFFYGTTSAGRVDGDGRGSVFKFYPDNNDIEYGGFGLGSGGDAPMGSLVLSGNKLYGMTSQATLPSFAFGGYNSGAIFEVDAPDDFNPNTRLVFNQSKGAYPNSLVYENGKYYGATTGGGVSNLGTVFEWNPQTNIYTKLYDSGPSNSSGPFGLVQKDGKLYGVEIQGAGPNFGAGSVYQFNSITYQYTNLKEFDYDNSSEGNFPNYELVLFNNKFYGINTQGGANDSGGIFELNPQNNQYTLKYDFPANYSPSGALLEQDSVFYGLSESNQGVIYEWNPSTNQFTERATFNGSNGANPQGRLAVKDGKFYGMTSGGGANNQGVIFEWNPVANTLINKFSFGGNNGAYPQTGELLLYDDKFYGVVQGGANQNGLLFEWNPDTNVFTKLANFDGNNGRILQSLKLMVVPTVWQGGNAANWNNPANWSGGQVPNGSDVVIIPQNVQITINSAVSAGNLTLPQGSSLVIADGANIELQSFSGQGEVIFSGNTPKTIPANMTNIATLTLNNTTEVSLSESINVSNTVNIQNGSLNLAGNNLNLGDTGELNEDLANNRIVKDATAIDENTSGGAITASNRTVSSLSQDIAGLGLDIQRTMGSNYAVDVTRYHYQALNTSIQRVYGVTGNVAGTNTTLRINYAESELAGIAVEDLRVLRYSENVAPFGWNEVAPPFFPSAVLSAGTNYVEVSNINSFSLWTLGKSIPALNPVLEDVTAECSVTLTAPVINDPRFGEITGTTSAPLTYSLQGTYQVNWSFTDGNNNVINAIQNVIVDDVTAPLMPTIADATGECSVTVTAPTTSDACAGAIIGTTTDPLTYSLQGTYQITWTFNDGNGNSTTAIQNVIVDDVTAPLTPTIADATRECSATVTAPTTSDVCAGTITGTTTDPLTYSLQGTYQITWTFDDGNGNSTTAIQNVIVDDVTAPLTPTIADATRECSVTVTAPTTSDVCAGTIIGTTSDPLTYSLQGTYQITWTFNDGNGNSTTAIQNVIVDDVTTPVITLNGSSSLNVEAGSAYTELGASVTDNCAEGLSVVIGGDAVNTSVVGTYVITYNANDGNGNNATQITRTVNVQDTQAPTAPTLSAGTITTTSIQLNWTGATDNVGVVSYDVYQGLSFVTNTLSSTYTVTGLNPNTAYTFTVKAKDAQGNTSNASNELLVSTQPEPITTTQRLEVENGFTKITDIDNDVIVTRGGGAAAGTAWSNGFGVSLPDIGDRIRLNFNAANTGQYIIKVRVRSGNSSNSTLFWPDKYGFTLNNAPITLLGNTATISALSSAFSGSYFGTMESAVINLTAGSQSLDITTLRTAGAIDYIEVISLGGSDNIAPTAPVLSLQSKTSTTINLVWTAATDNVGVVSYEVYQGLDLIAGSNTTNYLVTGLNPNTAYNFTVKAKDAAGNTSILSNILNLTTDPVPTTVRVEAENNFTLVNDPDLDVASTNGGGASALSNGLGVRLPDVGDKIRVNFTVNTAGQYIIRARVRSGITTSPTIFWDSPNKYTTTIDEAPTVFTPILSSNTGPSPAFGGSFFGTMETAILNLTVGSHYASFQAFNRAWGVVDYIELVWVGEGTNNLANQDVTMTKLARRNLDYHKVHIYPNPSQDFIKIEFPYQIAESQVIDIQLINPQGKVVYQKQLTRIEYLDLDVRNFAKGWYFLKIHTPQNPQAITQKVLIY
jgi:uncharacterized repeat protein (TIGR03803 family)